MRNKPNQKTEVKHSLSRESWNIIGVTPGLKYKVARIPYIVIEDEEITNTQNKAEALEHALFISWCFNNADKINY